MANTAGLKKPCRSPYCECEQGKCTHPGFYDARNEPKEKNMPRCSNCGQEINSALPMNFVGACCKPKPHKHAALIKAWADGAEIEHLSSLNEWCPAPFPNWHNDREYRIKPQPHKWQKEMDAHKAGKTIQVRAVDGTWMTFGLGEQPNWNNAAYQYRIKPETVKYRLFWWRSPYSNMQMELGKASQGDSWDKLDGFVGWHGDWQEAEVPNVPHR